MHELSSGTILVIGAGPAGLAAAASLKALGVPFEIVDAQNHVGGVWNVANDDAPSWPSKRMTTSKNNGQFEDLRMPVSFPAYPSTDEYATYLRAYTAHHQLTDYFTPNTEVRRMRDFGEGTWEVEFSNGAVRPYAGIIAAHGVSNRPFLPPLFLEAKERGANVIHSKNFAGAEFTPAKNVLVIGSGQCAADVATELADGTRRVALHASEGHWVVPRTIGGVSADTLAQAEPGFLGARLNEAIAEKAVHTLVGHPASVGLPEPTVPLLEDEVIVSDDLLPMIADRRIELLPDARHLPFESFDLIVFATGYEPGADYLPPHLADNLVLGAFPADRSDIAVLGQVRVQGSVTPVLVDQADIAAYVMKARQEDNTAQLAAFDALKALGDEGIPVTRPNSSSGGVRGTLAHLLGRGAASTSRTSRALLPTAQAPSEDRALELPLSERRTLLQRLQVARSIFEQ
ncbi:MAG: NAD(P)-binding domain-containing protein [Dermabacter sp.]|nr:NAD(P)-binding domain-containing protein [Dermabacter sp.]